MPAGEYGAESAIFKNAAHKFFKPAPPSALKRLKIRRVFETGHLNVGGLILLRPLRRVHDMISGEEIVVMIAAFFIGFASSGLVLLFLQWYYTNKND